MTLDCNHDCKKCPAWTLGGRTSCMLINKMLAKLDHDEKTALQLLRNAQREGDKNDKNI